MKIITIWTGTMLVLLPCCKKINVKPEFARIKDTTQKTMLTDPVWQRLEANKPIIKDAIDTQLEHGIMSNDAIRIALQNNPTLQAQFEELGIAKADLQQAGFFTNPQLETLFKAPISKNISADIEAQINFTLSDFWQVPLRKNIAYDDLEIITNGILRDIIMLTAQTAHAFQDCVYHLQLSQLTQVILSKVKQLRDRIYYRYKFGFTSELDKQFANIMVNKWELELNKQDTMLQQAFLNLRRLLGIKISYQDIQLIDNNIPPTSLPALEDLHIYALEHRPEMHIAHFRIKRAEDKIAYEKSRFIKEVNFGIAYERDPDKTKTLGPAFGLSIPIFDTNKAQVERAQFELHQAESQYRAQKQAILQELYSTYTQLLSASRNMMLYTEQMIPASQEALAYTSKYFDSMQLNMVILINTEIALYEIEKEKLAQYNELIHLYIDLEKITGKRFTADIRQTGS